ncbi:hypothetical protein MNBD_GAMMA13-1584 [hydrothermal vent metagenome]|uniref:J domain-containing protein n=1 Tax=hydrothermal vent metagenome TaxID=652676 RepID=A0A3B0XVS7_9ZZZZ
MKSKRNYYKILHVQPDAPQAIIKSSYHTLMHKLKQHPDVGGDHQNAVLINEAYAVISDPEKRAKYDNTLVHTKAPEAATPPRNKVRKYQPMVQNSCTFCGTAHLHGKTPSHDAVCAECTSPLKSAEKHRLEKSSRRIVQRIEKHIQVDFYKTWPQKIANVGVMQDVSPRGMKFITDELPDPDAFIKIDCEICTAVARITFYDKRADTSGAEWVIGVEFITILFRETRGSFVSLKI